MGYPRFEGYCKEKRFTVEVKDKIPDVHGMGCIDYGTSMAEGTTGKLGPQRTLQGGDRFELKPEDPMPDYIVLTTI